MIGKKVRSRATFISLIFISLILITYILLKSLEENVIYFMSPTELKNKKNIQLDKKIRIGGMVKKNSIVSYPDYIVFIVTDYKNEIYVTYNGSVPNLFSEGKGVVAEGKLEDRKFFIAEKILAKHDENYMPPEVNKALEQSKN